MEPIGMRSHLLIRIYLDVGQEEWFGMKMVPELGDSLPIRAGTEDERKNAGGRVERTGSRGKGTESRTQNAEIYCGTKRGHCGLLRALVKLFNYREQRTEKEFQKAKELERIRLLQERQEVLCKVEEDIQKLLSDILCMIGSWEGCFCVYEDGIYRALVERKNDSCIEVEKDMENCMQEENSRKENCMQEGNSRKERCLQEESGMGTILPILWGKYFQVREFEDYTKQLWVEEVLPEAILPHFVILGAASCLPVLIEKYADRMKSLRWVLPENDYTQEVQDFVEDFYIEYGLAIMMQVIPAGQRRLQAVCTEPSNVLDFTEEPYINLAKVAKGSIWLDMWSVEEKKRRIVGRSTGITYFSLKEKWKLVRKKEPFVPEI